MKKFLLLLILPAGLFASGWEDLALQNGISNYGSGYQNAQCKVMNTTEVLCRGLLLVLTGTQSDTVIATFTPAPLVRQFFAIIEGNNIIGQIDVDTSGNIRFEGFPLTAATWIGLNPIGWSSN